TTPDQPTGHGMGMDMGMGPPTAHSMGMEGDGKIFQGFAIELNLEFECSSIFDSSEVMDSLDETFGPGTIQSVSVNGEFSLISLEAFTLTVILRLNSVTVMLFHAIAFFDEETAKAQWQLQASSFERQLSSLAQCESHFLLAIDYPNIVCTTVIE